MFQLFPVARKKKNPLILKEIVFRGVFPSLFTVICAVRLVALLKVYKV